MRTSYVGLCALAWGLMGCTDSERETAEAARTVDASSGVTEVEDAVWAFYAADTAMNAEAVVDMLWPEFYMFGDGRRADYDAAVTGARSFFPSLEVFATEWTDLRVTPLGPDHALASFVFRDSIVTKAGDLIQMQGPNTFIWERRNGAWKVLYTDADHYPVGK